MHWKYLYTKMEAIIELSVPNNYNTNNFEKIKVPIEVENYKKYTYLASFTDFQEAMFYHK